MGAGYSDLDSHTYRASTLTHIITSLLGWIFFLPDRGLCLFAMAKLDRSYLFLETDLQKERKFKNRSNPPWVLSHAQALPLDAVASCGVDWIMPHRSPNPHRQRDKMDSFSGIWQAGIYHPPYLPTILLYTNEQKVHRGLHRKVLAMLGYHVSPCLEKAKIKPHNNNENHSSKIQHICLTQEIVTGLQSCWKWASSIQPNSPAILGLWFSTPHKVNLSFGSIFPMFKQQEEMLLLFTLILIIHCSVFVHIYVFIWPRVCVEVRGQLLEPDLSAMWVLGNTPDVRLGI